MAINRVYAATWTSRVLSILRIIAAFLIIPHGTQKLFNVPPMPPPPPSPQSAQSQTASAQPAKLPPLIVAAGAIELAGGVLLLLGLFTRFAAFILSGEMAVAYFMGHAPGGFWPIVNKGELAVIFCFVFLFLAVAGGGAWSIERLWGRRTA